MRATVIYYSAPSYFEIEPSFFTSETIELISASVPLLSAITLIMKGLFIAYQVLKNCHQTHTKERHMI